MRTLVGITIVVGSVSILSVIGLLAFAVLLFLGNGDPSQIGFPQIPLFGL